MYIYICIYIYTYYIHINVRNNFAQLSSNFCVKIATQIVNWVTICSNRVAIILLEYARYI